MLINVYVNDNDVISTEDSGTIESILASSNIEDSLEREIFKLRINTFSIIDKNLCPN